MRTFFSAALTVFVIAQLVIAPPAFAQDAPAIEMVRVQGGRFLMGCPGEGVGCLADERPIHEVRLRDYYIGKYPVTQAQWTAVMGTNPSYLTGDDDRPVEQVSWNDVQTFIERLNAMSGKRYRLPTEAEWEYAALGGPESQERGRRERREEIRERAEFLADIAWYSWNSGGTTHAVGQKLPNLLGVHDMIGNVWEWVYDRYDRHFYRDSPLRNPRGPRFGEERTYRGCSFLLDERHCRPSVRNFNNPNHRAIYLGFRLAMSP